MPTLFNNLVVHLRLLPYIWVFSFSSISCVNEPYKTLASFDLISGIIFSLAVTLEIPVDLPQLSQFSEP